MSDEQQPVSRVAPGLDAWSVAATLFERIKGWRRLVHRSFLFMWVLLGAVLALDTGGVESVNVFGFTLTKDNQAVQAVPFVMVALLAVAAVGMMVSQRLYMIAKVHLTDVSPELPDVTIRELAQPPGMTTVLFMSVDELLNSDGPWYRRLPGVGPFVVLMLLVFGFVLAPSAAAAALYDDTALGVVVIGSLMAALLASVVAAHYVAASDPQLDYALEWKDGRVFRRSDRKQRRRQIERASRRQLTAWVLQRATELSVLVPIEINGEDAYTAVTYHPTGDVHYYMTDAEQRPLLLAAGNPPSLIHDNEWTGMPLAGWTDDETRTWLYKHEDGATQDAG